MKQKFDIAKRNADARREIVILDNEILYSEQRLSCLGRSWSNAEKDGDKERAERLHKSWSEEREYLDTMKCRRQYLIVITAEKKYANQHLYTDINPFEVVEELGENRLMVRAMKCTLKEDARKALQASFVPGGFVGHFDNDAQEWEYLPDTTAKPFEIRRHKDGRWYQTGSRHCPFTLSTEPHKHYDYNF